MATKRKSTARKAATRRIVASGVLSGQSTKAIAQNVGTSQRSVQRIAVEPETQFLITEAFIPCQARLRKLARKAIEVIENAMGAMKTDKQDHTSRLKAVERYGDLLVLAQGKVAEKPVEANPQFTWEEFTAMYNARKSAAAGNSQSPTPAPCA